MPSHLWHMASASGGTSPGARRAHAGLDFASFGADLGAAQAAALQFYEARAAADNRRAVQAATSVGTLLNGVQALPSYISSC